MTGIVPTTSRARTRLGTAAAALVVTVSLVALVGCGGPDGIEGTVVAVTGSGTSSKDRALGGGWIAVLEDDSLLGFLTGSGIDAPTTDELPSLAGRVLHDDVTRAGGTLATIDADGKFTLRATGRHTVCRLVEAGQVDLLKGCAVVDLPTNGRLRLSTGEAGLHAALDD